MGADVSYSIRGNHTHLPSTRLAYNEFDLLPDPQYRMYWLFANLQQTLDRCDTLALLIPQLRHPPPHLRICACSGL